MVSLYERYEQKGRERILNEMTIWTQSGDDQDSEKFKEQEKFSSHVWWCVNINSLICFIFYVFLNY